MKCIEDVFKWVLKAKDGAKILVVVNESKTGLGKEFFSAAERYNPVLYVLPEKDRPLKSIPKDLDKMLDDKWDIIINLMESHALETPFRIGLLNKEKKTGARIGHGPGITEEMIGPKGPLSIDYPSVIERANRLMALMDGAKSARITTRLGTDMDLNIENRAFNTDVEVKKGSFGNLPVGEIWCAPVEDGANGEWICDASIGDIGAVNELHLMIKDGRLAGMKSRDPGLVEEVEKLLIDEQSRVIGEFGIGLNPNARITGNLLEDEKALHTVHIALGNNDDMPGGRNTSKTHRDFLIRDPTVVVIYKDGRKINLMEDGEFLQA
jgi:leucyl aminopeptidase (aminopeptidase T)